MFKLEVFEIIDKSQYPIKLNIRLLGKFKSLHEAMEEMGTHVQSQTPVYEYSISEYKNRRWLNCHIFSSQGHFVAFHSDLDENVPFTGEDNPKYKLGTLVEVRNYDEVLLGIISGEPLTTKEYTALQNKNKGKYHIGQDDNVYIVSYDNVHDHSHPYEWQIKMPSLNNLPEEKVAELKSIIVYPTENSTTGGSHE